MQRQLNVICFTLIAMVLLQLVTMFIRSEPPVNRCPVARENYFEVALFDSDTLDEPSSVVEVSQDGQLIGHIRTDWSSPVDSAMRDHYKKYRNE